MFHSPVAPDASVSSPKEKDDRHPEDFSNSVILGFRKYLTDTYGEDRYRSFIRRLQVDEEWFYDRKQWHSADFAERFYRDLRAAYSEDPQIVTHSMWGIFTDPAQKFFSAFLGLFATPEAFLSMLPQAVKRMNRYNQFEKGAVERKGVTSTARLIQRSRLTHPYLDEALEEAGLASLGSNIQALGYQIVSLRIVHSLSENLGYSEFEVTWVNRPLLTQFMTGLAAAGLTYFLCRFFQINLGYPMVPSVLTGLLVMSMLRSHQAQTRIRMIFEHQNQVHEDLLGAYRSQRELNQKIIDYQRRFTEVVDAGRFKEVSYGIIHDMASPVTLLNFYAKSLNKALDGEMNPEKVAAYCRSIEKATGHLKKLQDLFRLSWKSLENQEVVTADFADTIRECVDLFEPFLKKYEIQMTDDLPEHAPIQTYQGLMQSLILNLTQNAVNALRDCPRRVISVKMTDQGDHWYVTFADTGPGIPPDRLKDLWKKFGYSGTAEKKKEKENMAGGSGWGMSHIKRIVDAAEGTVQVDTGSTGTTFKFRFPKKL